MRNGTPRPNRTPSVAEGRPTKTEPEPETNGNSGRTVGQPAKAGSDGDRPATPSRNGNGRVSRVDSVASIRNGTTANGATNNGTTTNGTTTNCTTTNGMTTNGTTTNGRTPKPPSLANGTDALGRHRPRSSTGSTVDSSVKPTDDGDERPDKVIKQVHMHVSGRVEGIKVVYADGQQTDWLGAGAKSVETFELSDGEYITDIWYATDEKSLQGILFGTSAGGLCHSIYRLLSPLTAI